MLDQALLQQVRALFEGLNSHYIFDITVSEAHASKTDFITLLNEVASCSEHISCKLNEGEGLSFRILKDNEPTSIVFHAVPTGHEFTTLLLAILNLEGKGKNLPDEVITRRIKALKGDIHLKSYISLSCTNCPDVVQALNVMSILNPAIRHEIIDGAINKAEVDALNIQAVPAVYTEGEMMHAGRAALGELLEKLENRYGSEKSDEPVVEKAYDVIVVGGGPAGTSAAIYSARKGLSVALVAERIGGQVLETVGIENLISVPQTTGKQLGSDLKAHLDHYSVDLLENRKIDSARIEGGRKVLNTSLGEQLSAPALIIATGASWRKLNVPGESDYIGSGIAFCTHCDGPFYKGKKVAVVGGGNSGLEAAIDLSGIATHVTVLEFMNELKGDRVLQEKLHALPNVEIITNVATKEILGDGQKVTSMQYTNRETGEVIPLEVDGVFVQIGLTANSSPFKELVEVNRMGEILIDAHCRTSVPGIYAAGDVSTVPYKQIVIAMGEGAKASLSAFEDHIKGNI
ncbi:MAG: alkyl hydroperoxide reductase subunit F [Bacteroidales bacterium]